ncbi:MAG: SDR family oxidoreductase [Anaerolineales bacterium]|nr:SDR family oxidoreductase [Anaerolineales bacterium]
MRILVTGASGLLGLNLALAVARRHTVYGTVRGQRLHTDAFHQVQADLLAPGAMEAVLDEARPDWVVHCAAMANVDACEADPAQARKVNSELPTRLAEHVGRGGARLVHVSTDAVFDGRRGDYGEEDEPNPLSVYARTKLEGERLVAAANPQAIIARVNFYGWSLSGKRSLAEFFFYNLQADKQVLGFTDVYFCPLFVDDLAELLLRMLETRLSGLYHVVCRQSSSKYEFGVQLARRFGLDAGLITPAKLSEAGLVASRSPRLTLRTDKLTRELGEAPPDLSTGLEHFYTRYQQGYPQFIQGLGE